MLSAMRSGKYRYFFYGLLGLLALGLIGIGSGGVGSGSVRSIGKVGDQSIPVSTYVQTMQSTLQGAAAQIGRPLSPAEIQNFGIERNVLNAVISSAALDNEAKRLGLSVGDDAVAEAIRSTPAYQGITGTFDKEAYDFALERARVTAADNENSIREIATRGLLERAVGTGYGGSDGHASIFVKFANETRDIDWAAINVDDLPSDIPAPTDEDLQKFYKDNPDQFTSPETKEITYALLTPDMVIEDIEIDDALLRQDYDAQASRFSEPERRIVDRIVFGDMAQATDARNRLDAETVTYEDLIAERGLTEEDVDLGEVEQSGLSTEAAKLLFAQQEPGIYGPVQSDLGPAVYRINAVLDAVNTSFEEARDELFGEAVAEEANLVIAELVETLDDKLAAGDTLEILAEDTELTLETISFNVDSENDIASYAEFRAAASAAKIGDFEKVEDLSDGGIFVLRVDAIKPAALMPFDVVKEKVTAGWTEAQKLVALSERATEIVKGLTEGKSFADLGVEGENNPGASRNLNTNGLPNDAKLMAFDIDVGTAVQKQVDDTIYVIKLNGVTEADINSEDNKILMESLKAQLTTQTAADVVTLFSDAVRAEAGVTLNQAAINSLNSQITSY